MANQDANNNNLALRENLVSYYYSEAIYMYIYIFTYVYLFKYLNILSYIMEFQQNDTK